MANPRYFEDKSKQGSLFAYNYIDDHLDLNGEVYVFIFWRIF